jgi:hypothetical protein
VIPHNQNTRLDTDIQYITLINRLGNSPTTITVVYPIASLAKNPNIVLNGKRLNSIACNNNIARKNKEAMINSLECLTTL